MRMLKDIDNFEDGSRRYENSEWACAARVVNNYFLACTQNPERRRLADDDAVAKLLGLENANRQYDVAQALFVLKCQPVGSDPKMSDTPFAADTLLAQQLELGKPVILVVSDTQLDSTVKVSRRAFLGGSYLVLLGIDTTAKQLTFFDPAGGRKQVPYTADSYVDATGETFYWVFTYFTDDLA